MKTLAGNDSTSPILRGVYIRRNLLCDTLAAPNPNSFPAGALEPPAEDPLLSTRKRFENKTSSAQCMSCHSQINPFGYALEGYDSLGRFRTIEKIHAATNGAVLAEHPVDAKASVPIDANASPVVNGGIELSKTIAQSPRFNACFAKQWFQFQMRRENTLLDNCQLAKTYDAVRKSGGSLLGALKATITDDEFKLRRMKSP
ncbi:MAG: DUF1588 domain-containing protein [Calothrix sp. SM1_5_4]|nr:DUF1588 domain-containing protein [Calothrix sp. SM1_5_4]